jgi:hypothetical protein
MAKNFWNTPVEWQGLVNRWGYDHSFLLCGSCFADRVGQKLLRSRCNATVNPCGMAFDPLSLARHIDQALTEKIPEDHELVYCDGLWHSLQHHGSFSSASKSETIDTITAGVKAMREALQNADVIIFTFGTAWYTALSENEQAITNAHKIPSEKFIKKLATVNQITASFSRIIPLIRLQNPKAKFMITVSPVRYLRDGIEGNMRSKARLIESAHQICESLEQVYYFPAYEIVMDELRDYRWYSDDMLHVSPVTVEHIWEKFKQGTMNTRSLALMQQIEPLIKFTEHRPLHAAAEDHEQKCQAKEQEINSLIALYKLQNS